MARDPLSLFTDALTQGLGAGRARGNDDLAMLQVQQQQQQWNEGRSSRDAALRGQQLQNEASQFELENARRANSKRLAGEALLRMQSDPEWIHTPEGQRAISSAVNESPEYDDEGIEGFKTLGRDEARLMGMDDGVYSRIVASNHPDGVDDPDDRLVVPLRRGESGDLVPFDMDDQGNVTTYSMSRLNSVLQTLAGNPDAVGEAMGGLYTGQPGASVQAYGAPGGGGGGAPASGGTSVGTSALAAPAASQAPQNGSSAPQYRTEDLAMAPEQAPRSRGQSQDAAGGLSAPAAGSGSGSRPYSRDPDVVDNAQQAGANMVNGLIDTGKAIASDVTEGVKSTYNRFFGKDGAEVASRLPAVEGESQESATGRPATALSKDALRASRRVFEGKGVSAAQAKQLADDPEQAAHIRNTDPTPRAIAGATANVMSGMQQRSGRGGAPEFTVGAGKKPSTKQLSSAALLMSAGVIKPEDLKRYADLGVISEDGVSTMQQGMASATSRANNYDSNATSVRNTDASNAAAMARTQFSENAQNARFKYGQDREDQRMAAKLQASGQSAPKTDLRQTLEDGEFFARRQLQDSNIAGFNDLDEDEQTQMSQRIANRAADYAQSIPPAQRNDDTLRDTTRSIANLTKMDDESNGFVEGLYRLARGRPYRLDLADNAMAVAMDMNNSPLLKGDAADAEGFYSTVIEPFESGLDAVGASNLKGDVGVQRRIMARAAQRAQQAAARNPEIFKDRDALSNFVYEEAQREANLQ